MISKEESAELMGRLWESRPRAFFKHFDEMGEGTGCAVRILAERREPMSSGERSAALNVSTARMAVVLKKLGEKGYIDKHPDPADGRRTLISLSSAGREKYDQLKDEFLAVFAQITEKVGKDKICQFIEISCDIKAAVEAIAGNGQKHS